MDDSAIPKAVRALLRRQLPSRAARSLLVLGLLACSLRNSHATPSEQVPIGPRAIAMGGAYSSLAMDASALFWNPAGLSWIGHQELAGTYANLYQTDIRDNYAAFILPISRRHAVGVDWYHSGFDDSELSFGENRFDLSWAAQLHRKFSAGITAKYLTRNTDLDGSMVSHGTGLGMDAGILANPFRGLRLGVVAQDLFNTSIHSDGTSTLAYPRNLRAGASYSYRDRALLAFDVDDRWHVGAEVRPLDLLAVRAGMEKDRQGSEGATFTTGIGLKAGIFRLDYAYVIHPSLAATSHFGLTMAFNFNPAQVRIEKIETDEIFASLYKSYARVPFGRAVIRNLSNKALDARISVQIPGFMDEPYEHNVVLARGAAEPVDLFATLNENTMAISENKRLPVRVSASYTSDRLDRTDRASWSVPVYEPGVIDWGQGVDQAAAFITTDDPVVDSVAIRAIRAVSGLSPNPFAGRNVANAAAIFDALTTLGVSYVPDPNNPYPKISDRDTHGIDRINYPRQTLAKRAGDCDDTTILLAALLGHVGIPTKLVDVPGHLFLLFDTGSHERDRLSLGLDEGLFEVVDDGVWIPVETTALREGFAEAWRSGAAKYAASKANNALALVDVAAAQSRFESNLPVQALAVPAIDSDALMRRLAADANLVAGWQADYLQKHYPEEPGGVAVSGDARDALAHVNYLAGEIDVAVQQLEAETRDRPQSARAHNNLGNAHAARGELSVASEDYRRALERDQGDAGIWLNSGLVQHAKGDTTLAAESLAQGLARSGGYAQACRLLGLPVEDSEVKAGSAETKRAQVRRLLRATLGRIPPLDSLRSANAAPRPPKTKLKPIRMISAASRGDAPEEADLRSILYWRERE
jgi:hypothetical protein